MSDAASVLVVDDDEAVGKVLAALMKQGGHNATWVPSAEAALAVLEKKAFDATAFEKEKGRIAAQLRDAKRNQLFQAYMSEARKRFPIERNAEAIRRVVG